MATYQAISAACEAVVQVLRANYEPHLMGDTELEFKVYGPAQFATPMTAGVSLFLYRVMVNGTIRNPAPRGGGRGQPRLPLELHMLLTAWGGDPSLQNAIAGWMMRTLQDHPTVPAALLNSVYPHAFQPEETIDLVPGEISTEDLLHLWELLTKTGYQLSVPYVARVVYLDSEAGTAVARVDSRNVQLERIDR